MSARHVVVAGGSRGIGAACAAHFRDTGDRVSVLSRSSANPVDLRDPEAAARAIARTEADHGPVDVLVCTAGAARQAPLADLDATALREGMEAKYFPYVNAIMATLPGMVSRRSGVIIPVIGIGGKLASPTHLPGGAANAALMLLTAGLGHSYAGHGIRVTGINPGPVATERFQQMLSARAAQDNVTPAEAQTRIESALPASRVPLPAEIAELVFFLASPAAGALNGIVIPADGGATPVI